MADIQATAAAANQTIATSGRSGSLESASTERKVAADSEIERKEAEPSATLPGVGDNVDIQA
ncbi:hypothetical protein [Kordiimonas pumila]|uniref:Uncharacterized protein n=1 Tax=Kordiimonas pumila TaxID=2161677 RepID=A0ABV7D216_9PROT|nr:hypothetical protein [Kordiimonas pumila]